MTFLPECCAIGSDPSVRCQYGTPGCDMDHTRIEAGHFRHSWLADAALARAGDESARARLKRVADEMRPFLEQMVAEGRDIYPFGLPKAGA